MRKPIRSTWLAAAVWLLLAPGALAAPRLTLPGVSATSYAPIGAALDTTTPVAGGDAIQIGGNCVPNQASCALARRFPYGSHPVELVVLNRADLSTVTSQGLGAGQNSANSAAALASKYGQNERYLMVLAAHPGASTSPGYSRAIAIITGSPNTGIFNYSGAWAAAGVPHATPLPGQVWGTFNPGFVADGGHPEGDLRGYFQRAQVLPTLSEYSFVSGRYLSYDTQAPGSCPATPHSLSQLCSGPAVDVMQIGPTRYALTLPDPTHCRGGYAILVLAAANLVPLSQGAYATNCQSGGEDSAGWRAVNARLSKASRQDSLVFIQSIGNPANPGCLCSSFGYSAGPAIERLGASAETWNRSLVAGGYLNERGNSGYAMAGSSSIQGDALPGSRPESYAPEAVSAVSGHGARLQGLLRGDYQWNYLPVTGSDSPQPLGSTVATNEFLPASPWPTGGTPGELKVLQYISEGTPFGPHPFEALKYSAGSSCYRPAAPDVRFEFCDTTRDYADVAQALTADPPAECECSLSDWQRVTRDLSLEISARNVVVNGISTLQQVYGTGLTCSNATVALQNITSKIVNAVKVSGDAAIAGGLWDLVVSDSLNVLSSILYQFPENAKAARAANILNNFSAVGYLASDLINTVEHYRKAPPTLADRVQAKASMLGPVLRQAYCTTQFGLGRAEAAILSDYRRLIAQGSSPALQASRSTLNSITPYLAVSAKRFVYEHLLPVVYHPYALLLDGKENKLGTPLAKYRCGTGAAFEHGDPWAKAPAGAYINLSPRDPVNPLGHLPATAIVLSSRIDFATAFTSVNPRLPPAAVMRTITSSLAKGGLGVSPLDLLLHHFRRYAVKCGPFKAFHSNGYLNDIYGPSDVSWP